MEANNSKKKKCPESQGTEHEALVFALSVVHSHDVNDANLADNAKLEMCRPTLKKIANGEVPVRGYQKYMEGMVVVMNDLRLKAIYEKDELKERRIMSDMLDILLVNFGIATDAEMNEREAEKRRQDILREIKM